MIFFQFKRESWRKYEYTIFRCQTLFYLHLKIIWQESAEAALNLR